MRGVVDHLQQSDQHVQIEQSNVPGIKLGAVHVRGILAALIGLVVIALIVLLNIDIQSPLSTDEQKLVGEWSPDSGGATRVFLPDRRLVTTDGAFKGVWRIEKGELRVSYWSPFEAPRSMSFSDVQRSLFTLKRSFEKEKYTTRIEFAADGQSHAWEHPVDALHPDGKWWFTRVTDR